MTEKQNDSTLTATHHALLFAWLSRALVQQAGPAKGEEVMRKAVRRYGEQRGHRMALRARSYGHPLTMANYLAYGEWKAGPGQVEQCVVENTPNARVEIHRCPWYTAWQEHGLLPYGRVFCQEIDEALVRGFNPDLVIEVLGTQSNGNPYCDFVFQDANLTRFNYLGLAYKKAVKPGPRAIMPWDYHLGHLYKTTREIFVEELGQAGEDAARAASEEFAHRFGDAAALAVEAHIDTDFEMLSQT